ncbi:DUF4199 domain-containing protein [Marivirga atlantica]|jgi:hypothetical protein|uniref:DUF4199 domain-containing protein n=1 Tax=Marivirga atlantica TaxID=1548457 RepID=A0A937ALP5_9BACT|nr:DUF4199 domain-containing protein [Marivirga atlantica]MBL0764997.1 DUF4199 domain-containing protein [Marivirga atlantica]
MNLILKVSLRYSIIAFFFIFLMFFISILIDKNPVVYTSNIVFIGPLIAIFLFLAIKAFKQLNQFGLRFWQGFSVGMLYTIFFTILFASFLVIYANFFDEVYFDEYRQMIMEKLMAGKDMLVENLGEDGYKEYLKSSESSNTRIIGSLSTNNIIIGMLVTPLVSLFMRTNEPKA